jgi:hypothetical protein
MLKYAITMAAMASVLVLSIPVAMGYTGNSIVMSNDTHGISIENGDVIIRNDQGGKARITPDGALIIANQTIKVALQQTTLLRDYVSIVKDIEIKGIQLGKDAARFAASTVADVLSGLFTGADEDKISEQAKVRARTFKQKALPICKDVQNLHEIQDNLANSIDAFQPYAVIKASDAHECEQDIISND